MAHSAKIPQHMYILYFIETPWVHQVCTGANTGQDGRAILVYRQIEGLEDAKAPTGPAGWRAAGGEGPNRTRWVAGRGRHL
jgi:hypothetical protein